MLKIILKTWDTKHIVFSLEMLTQKSLSLESKGITEQENS